MSITLPPLPESPHHGDFNWGEVRAFATAYALAAVEADRASRVPMNKEQATTVCTAWFRDTSTHASDSLIRAVERYHGIGAKP